MTDSWNRIKEKAPNPLPPETCPRIDSLSVLADAISSDISIVRESLARSNSSIAKEAATDLLDTEMNLASLRLRLEELRLNNAMLRSNSFYWYNIAKTKYLEGK
jgi:hypothetical protein